MSAGHVTTKWYTLQLYSVPKIKKWPCLQSHRLKKKVISNNRDPENRDWPDQNVAWSQTFINMTMHPEYSINVRTFLTMCVQRRNFILRLLQHAVRMAIGWLQKHQECTVLYTLRSWNTFKAKRQRGSWPWRHIGVCMYSSCIHC